MKRQPGRAAPPARCALRVALIAAVILVVALVPRTGFAQLGDRSAPSRIYFAAFEPLFEGDYARALDVFDRENGSSIKTVQSRWIDAICYETMVGECHYQVGELDKALQHYTAALQIFRAFSDWMLRVQWPPTIRPAANVKPAPWGTSTRTMRVGQYPSTVLTQQGQIDQNDVVKRGGVVQMATLFPISAQEIVRTTCLALRRRAEILGPTSPHDDLNSEVLTALLRRPGPPNHWSEAWVQLETGLALIAAGKDTQAVTALRAGVLAGGEYEHPMSCVALLELGRLALKRGDYAEAATQFAEASYSAYQYDDVLTIEEALRLGSLTHLLANRPGVYAPLAPAAAWAKAKQLRHLQASMLVCLAEQSVRAGQTKDAFAQLQEARAAMGRRAIAHGRIGTRASFIDASALYQQRKVSEGDSELNAALTFMQRGSFWLFQIGISDALVASKKVSNRVAAELYREVLRDPQAADWHIDPLESLAVLTTPHGVAYERWFETAMERKEHELAIEIADRARRHRFFTTLQFGGRLESLRWVLEGPIEALDQQAQLNRQDLLTAFPEYAALKSASDKLRAALTAQPLDPGLTIADAAGGAPHGAVSSPAASDAPAAAGSSLEMLKRLAEIGAQQEALLREIAVRREPAALVFPPLKTTSEVQKSLPKGTAVLVFFATSRQLYGFLLNGQQYSTWNVKSADGVKRGLQSLLRDLGMFQANHELSLAELASEKWRKSAAQTFELLMQGSRSDFSQGVNELVVVPDGVTWYLPFELMPITVDGKPQSLIERTKIRYAPTFSLATSAYRPRNAAARTAVVAGRMHAKLDADTAAAAVAQLVKAVPGAVLLRTPLPVPAAVLALFFQRLIVLDEITPGGESPYDWSPLALDRGKGNELVDWFNLPWGGPDEIILPGLHTAAEDSLKTAPRAPGQEIFVNVCALMSEGARTLLLSRWRTGGPSGYDIVREFAQELPHTRAADAWQRAVLVTMTSPLDAAAEPRVKRAEGEQKLDGRHPFFWAGYLLVDLGMEPKKSDEPPAAEAPVVAPLGAGDAVAPPANRDAAGGTVQPPPDSAPPNASESSAETPPVSSAAATGDGAAPGESPSVDDASADSGKSNASNERGKTPGRGVAKAPKTRTPAKTTKSPVTRKNNSPTM